MNGSLIHQRKSFDGTLLIRAFACLAIIWNHIEPPMHPIYLFKNDVFSLFYYYGGTSVFIFYLLSGYGIGYGFFSRKYRLSGNSLIGFYLKRFLRIAPAYFLVIAACYLFIYKDFVIFRWDEFIRYITFRANTDPYGLPFGGNHAIVTTEMQFYLVAPVLYGILAVFIRKVHPLFTFVLIFLSTLAVKLYLAQLGFIADGGYYMKHIYARVYGNIDLFLFGMFLSYLSVAFRKSILAIKNHISSFLIIPIFIVWLGWANWFNIRYMAWTDWPILIYQRYYLLPFSIIFLFGWLILASSTGKAYIPTGSLRARGILQMLRNPRLSLYGIGVLSYGIYLWQYPIIFYLYKRPGHLEMVNSWPAFFVRFGIITGASVFVAFLSYVFLEEPTMRLYSRISRSLKVNSKILA